MCKKEERDEGKSPSPVRILDCKVSSHIQNLKWRQQTQPWVPPTQKEALKRIPSMLNRWCYERCKLSKKGTKWRVKPEAIVEVSTEREISELGMFAKSWLEFWCKPCSLEGNGYKKWFTQRDPVLKKMVGLPKGKSWDLAYHSCSLTDSC